MDQELNIIKKYCGDIRARIHVCRNRDIAEMLKTRLCRELDSHCQSKLVHQMLVNYVDQIIHETFDENGFNIFLEE